MAYFMTIDAGTGSARAIIFDTKGNQVGISQQEWSHLSEDGVPNSMGFDTKTNWKIVATCIQGAILDANVNSADIKAVTATSMREGIVLYDVDHNELFGVANVDARADKEVAHINTAYPDLEKEFYALSGQTFALGALPRLIWVKNNKPAIYKKTKFISMISDWVLVKLSNVIATDPSNAGTTGIFNLSTRNWETSMATKLDIKDDIFPPVVETGTQIGEVTSEAAEACGLKVGTPVIMGGGDVQLGSAGLGVVEANECAILGGTFWQQLVNMDTAKTHPSMDIRVNPHVIEGLSQAEGISFFSGFVMRWFRDNFCHEEVTQAKQAGIDPYSLLEAQADNVPTGSYGILPIFSDVMKYGKWYHAAPSFLNLDINLTNSKAAMFRALEENAAIVSMLNLQSIFEFTGVGTQSITFAGGASKGALWSQILADVTQKQIHIPKVNEATALGGAFACGVATGEYDSIAQASKAFIQWEKTYEPNSGNKALYEDVAEKWKAAYASSLQLVDDNITTSMWKAPGL
jgi:autoinducer 2 (AI-2) kinase